MVKKTVDFSSRFLAKGEHIQIGEISITGAAEYKKYFVNIIIKK